MTQKNAAGERLAKEKYNLTDEQFAESQELMSCLKDVFATLYGQLPEGDLLRFCKRDDTAFAIFGLGLFAMMMPDANVNRDVMADKKNLDYVYESAKASLMGGLVRAIRTKADDDMAKEVFHWGLTIGQQGIAAGMMPTGLGNWDFSLKP